MVSARMRGSYHTPSGRPCWKVAAVETLAPGFLIAMPQLGDPNFHRTVVFVFQHGTQGALGLVLNRPAPSPSASWRTVSPSRWRPGSLPRRFFVGGPVEPQRGFVLHDRTGVDEKQPLADGLFLTETLDALEALLADSAGNLRFYLGYTGWGPGQLEKELAAGAWLFTEAPRQRSWADR